MMKQSITTTVAWAVWGLWSTLTADAYFVIASSSSSSATPPWILPTTSHCRSLPVSPKILRGGSQRVSWIQLSSSKDLEEGVSANVTTSAMEVVEVPHIERTTKGEARLPSTVPPLPEWHSFRRFAIPCLGLWVSGPLLSLVDTAFVGLSSAGPISASQLAALGPATTFFDGATYLFAFLNVATTNLYSSARAKQIALGGDDEQAESVVRAAAKVAWRCGVGIMIFLLAFCRPLLTLYIGDKAASTPGLLDSAVDYVMIRAFSMPTTLLLGVLQAALLGAKDSVTPLVAIYYSTVINVIGDYILVKRFHMGLQGASLATLVAQWAGTLALLGPARRRLVRNQNFGLFQKKNVTAAAAAVNEHGETAVTGRSFLAFAAPVLTLIVGKLAAFGFMTHAAAAVPGQPTPLASHQILLSLFFFVSPFLEVISQTAQTFLPPYVAPVQEFLAARQQQQQKLQKKGDTSIVPMEVINYNPHGVAANDPTKPWLEAAFAVATRLLRTGTLVAFAIATLASLVPAYFGHFLTSDRTVQLSVKPLAKYLWTAALLAAPVAVAEGVLLARRELRFLATVYLFTTALLPAAFLRVKFLGGDVAQVWACFAAFQLFRALCFTGKIWSGAVFNKLFRRGDSTTSTVQAANSQ